MAKPAIRVEASDPECAEEARYWAARLGLPWDGEAELVLQIRRQGLCFRELGDGAPGPVSVDFVGGAAAHRRRFGGGVGQMIARAVGIRAGRRPTVIDATAGLGHDAFVLAGLGCAVTMIERHPVVAALLEDGLRRARADASTGVVAGRMILLQGDALTLLRAWPDEPPEVVYLDPMFPHRDKSALTKKEMRLFRPLVGDDADAPDLLAAARALATRRVVVKRPRQAAALGGQTPGYALEGRSSRFDVYLRKGEP